MSEDVPRLPLHVKVLAYSFSRGGAGIAAARLSRLVERSISLHYFAAEKSVVKGAIVDNPTSFEWACHLFKRLVSYLLARLMSDGNPTKHSLNLFSSPVAKRCLKAAETAEPLLHLHWINNDTLSVWQFGRLPRGTIVTLHDEWLYCGAEHYHLVESGECAFVSGYDHGMGVSGIDWNRIVWRAKREQLRNRSDVIFTVPSRWMLGRAKESQVLAGHDVRLLPNPIDTNVFQGLEQNARRQVRNEFGFDDSHIVFAVGAVKGKANPLKGYDVLLKAVEHLVCLDLGDIRGRIRFVFFGGAEQGDGQFGGFPAIHMGHLNDVEKLRDIYAMADCTIVPSRVESFGQVAAESSGCSTPVIAFKTSGLTDIVLDGNTGFLAEPYEPRSLAECMYKMAALSPTSRIMLGREGRRHVEREFSAGVIEQQYMRILADAKAIKTSINTSLSTGGLSP